MTGEVEAAGEIATGALWARAVGGASDSPGRHGGQCLNCGTALIGSHCHACGQSGHVHRSLGAIWHDLAHGVLHFEGKVWRTLPLLFFRPGALTRRFIAGERMRFVSPLALFLFSVFMMFAVISALGGEIAEGVGKPSTAEMVKQIDVEIVDAEARLTEARAAAPPGVETEDVVRHTASLGELRTARRAMTVGDADGWNVTDLKTGWTRMDKGIAKANTNPGLLIYKLQSSAYKFSWALIPLSVPFVWLLFVWRRGHHVYDHAVFVTYSLSFMTLLVIILSIAGVVGIPGGLIASIACFGPPLHMYKQLRGTYGLRRFSALWRTMFLISFAFTTLLFFLLMLLGMGLMG